MGLLSLGTPFTFQETEKYRELVHSEGIRQLVNSFKSNFYRDNDKLYWGDELEYMLVNLNSSSQNATLDVEHDFVLENLQSDEKSKESCDAQNVLFHPEYGRYMIEATPLRPYDGESWQDFCSVEANMATRRKLVVKELKDACPNDKDDPETHIVPFTVASFPRMGQPNFLNGSYTTPGNASHSLFLPDEIINRHVRFPTLTRNIRTRRGAKVSINVPMFKDSKTQSLEELDHSMVRRDVFPEDEEPFLGAALPGHIYMDSMGFGMGCCCLQITLQAKNITESRYLFDTWLPLTPVFLALTSASPIFKGFLADQDVRWNVISRAVDDRTPIERATEPLKGHKANGGTDEKRNLQKIRKSRYDSIDMYLGDYSVEDKKFGNFKSEYNDLPTEINEKVYKQLKEEHGELFDETLARHFAHLYIRDPLVLFSEKAKISSDYEDVDHFLNIQSTNWQTLRFKPPAPVADASKVNSTPGWRVEFRPMEVQLTDFENAAFSVFTILCAKAFLKYRPNLYLPISLIDENMDTAHLRDSISKKYWFRNQAEKWNLLTIDEIINGEKDGFEGLIPLVQRYLKGENVENDKIQKYLKLVSLRASKELPTAAQFIRDFVTKHPDYKQDSIISEKINYDLFRKLEKISNYEETEEFFGSVLH